MCVCELFGLAEFWCLFDETKAKAPSPVLSSSLPWFYPPLSLPPPSCTTSQARHMCEIQRLMGCLLFVDRAAHDTPYADLLSPLRWEEVAHEFARQACSLMGQVGGGGRC